MVAREAEAESFGATIHLLNVVEESITVWPSGEAAAAMIPPALDELEAQARQELSKLLTADETKRFHARLVVICGSPSIEITEYAQSEKIDLIIMGTHGRSPIAHLLMGSVAEKVVRKAPCPVLIVRHPEHEFVVP